MNLQAASDLAYSLLEEFGLSDRWSFKFDGAKRRFGCCYHYRKVISLSRELVAANEQRHVEKTLRHEIAHALTGPGNGHNVAWKIKCLKVGAEPTRCYTNRIDGDTISLIQGSYIYRCPTCSKEYRRHRQSSRNLHCRICSDRFGVTDNRSLIKPYRYLVT